ncbi:MAG: phospho-N-acetylmuramoyl-pentapeptide-transferase [Peptococcaceae bacterium]|jgi:phospho-N-acetylmuramoyl-pentapeptide-transferase|nr:phospho-N-acetylmuramoyl-pentapeptide-transferase [Peptococcaceae bacterium]
MQTYLKAGLAALVVALLSGPVLIPALRRLKFGQYIRQEGPKEHLAKAGTPTMGGAMFFLTIPAALVAGGQITAQGLLAAGLLLGLGLLGCADDYLKIKKRQSEGLTVRQKFLGQIILALLFALLAWRLRGGQIWLPFAQRYWEPGWLYFPLAVLVVMGAANGVNFTDGLDGLCAGVTFLVALTYLLLCESWRLPQLSWLAGGLAGSCLGFLFFNLHPARVFMGDTGALALGGGVAALALLSGTELLLPLLGLVYVLEVLSVILQVGYFRWTGGRRLFRMSPLHHHFELLGWSENRVSLLFWLITLICGLLFLRLTL